MLKKLLFGGEDNLSAASNIGFFLLRLFTGLALVFGHGIGKIPPSPRFVEIVGKIGFPIPWLFAWAASLTEFAGGAFLALGLFTRMSGFFVAFMMATAVFGVHLNDGFAKKEKALLYLVIAAAFMFKGGSDWSIDSMIRRKS